MSWIDDLATIQFKITTGDKKIWYPKLVPNFDKNIEYNGTQYDFINRSGSLFARKLPKGRSYSLEFAFTGENNVREANSFEKSARDSRAWHIVHPFYGRFIAQPMTLSSNSNGLESTVIKTTVIETIVANQPKSQPDYSDLLSERVTNLKIVALVALTPITTTLPVKNIQTALKYTTHISKLASTITKLQDEVSALKKWTSYAENELNNTTGITIGYLTYMQNLITLPAIMVSNIGSRWQVLENTMSYLISTFSGIARIGYFEKLIYNLFGCTVISAMSTALTNQNKGDLETKKDVLLYINKFSDQYELFLNTLYGQEDSEFFPDHDLMFAIHQLVCDTTFYLYQVLFDAKQERTFYPIHDTNLIILAHKLYGSASEDNLSYLKSSNAIGLSEIFNIKKDRPIIYYV